MQTARRIYAYLLSGIGLGVLVWGLTLLLTALIEALGLASGPRISDAEQFSRERLTLAAALTAVSLPVWLIHWWLAERAVTAGKVEAAVERSSAVRGLFFALVLGILLAVAFGAAQRLLQAVITAILGPTENVYAPSGDLALFVVTGFAWGYHLSVRLRDWGRGPIEGEGAWLPRSYLYLAVLGGLLSMLSGLSALFDVLRQLVLEPADTSFGTEWWITPLASGVAGTLVGGLIWTGHWWYANRLCADPGWRGASERPARLRLAFYVAAFVILAIATIGFLTTAARPLLEAGFGITQRGGAQLLAAVVGPLLSAAIFGVAWWLHVRWLREENGEGGARAAAAWRLEAYPLALVGLAFGGVALGWLLGLLIDVVLGGGRTLVGGDTWRQQLSDFVPAALLGTGLWLWQWSRVRNRYAAAPAVEAAAATRRATLLLVLAVAVLIAVASLGVVLYRVFGTLFGIELSGDVVSELSTPLGALLMATAVALYHGLALRRDQAMRATAGLEQRQAAPAQAPSSRIGMILVGPPGVAASDVNMVLDRLRAELPDGYRLEGDA